MESQIADELLRAAIGAGSWQKAVDGIADLTFASRAQLVGVDNNKIVVFHYVTELDRKAFDEFDSIRGDDPFINPRWAVIEKTPELGVVGDFEYEQTYSILKSHDYLDYSRRWDIPFGAQATILKTPELRVFLNSLRTLSDGKSNEESRAVLSRIAPKVQNAIKLAQNLDFQGANLLSNAMCAMTKAAFICANDGKVITFTNIAEKIIRNGNLLKVENGFLKTPLPKNQSRIDLALKAAIETSKSQTFVLSSDISKDDNLVLDVNVLPHHTWDFSILPKLIITIREPQGRYSSDILMQMFDLSETEALIAVEFAQGKTREEIAIVRGVSIETIRTHLKNIFSKTGVNREIELMSKLVK